MPTCFGNCRDCPNLPDYLGTVKYPKLTSSGICGMTRNITLVWSLWFNDSLLTGRGIFINWSKSCNAVLEDRLYSKTFEKYFGLTVAFFERLNQTNHIFSLKTPNPVRKSAMQVVFKHFVK